MGIDLLFGRDFPQSDEPGQGQGILINETAARLLGPENPVGRFLTFPDYGDESMPVIGIIKDFHYEDMRHTVGPAFLTTAPMWRGGRMNNWFNYVLFRLNHRDLPAAVEEVKALWKRVLPEHDLQEVRFLDDAFAARYETERRVGTVMKWMSAIALVISCMGLVGLAALAAARRTREIGIRKVLGATTGSVLLLMSREFGWLVVGANAIAWPVALLRLRPLARLLRLPHRPEPGVVRAGRRRRPRRRPGHRHRTDLAGGADQPGGCVEIRVVGRVVTANIARER